MQVKIDKWGNSMAIRLPASALKGMGWREGDTLDLERAGTGFVMKPAKKKYTLEELLAQCDPDAPMSDEMKEWDAMPMVGNEKW